MKILDRMVSSIVSPPAFGLDISDFTVKFIKLSRSFTGEISVDYFGEANLPEGMVQEGEIRNVNDLASFLKNSLISQDGKKIKDVFTVATLPEERGFVHMVQLPKMRLEEAGKAARWELEGVVPLPAEKLYFDYSVLPVSDEAKDHMDLMVTAFPKSIVESYVAVLRGSGFIPVALELESQAITRALWSGEKEAVLFVDLGAMRTSLMTVVGGFLTFTRSIHLGGRDLDRMIAERLGVSEEKARQMKIEGGISKKYQEGKLFEALYPLINRLSDELKKHMAFYREHSSHRHGMPSDISRIVITGGDANLTNLSNFLSVEIGREVRIGHPFESMLGRSLFSPPFPKNVSLKYTTAIGAAIRGISW